MKNLLTSLLLLVPVAVFSQFINIPNNDYPVYTFNAFQQTDHTTDVFNYFGDATHTGFYTGQSEFWGFDVTTFTNTLFVTLSDLNSDQAFFATNHDNMGVMSWYITSQQVSAGGGGYGTSKMTYDPGTSNYLFCAEYWAPFPGYPLEFFSSASGAISTAATDLRGLVVLEVDGAGNILTICATAGSPDPVLLGDIDVDPSTGQLYVTASVDNGAFNQAIIFSLDVPSCTMVAGINDAAGVNSWGRGIDVENSQVFVVGDYQSMVDFGGAGGTSGGAQDVFVVEFDAALNPVNISVADAVNYAEGYDIEVYNNAQNIYVSGSIQEESLNWPMGAFGPAPVGALHGFIQTFWPSLGTPACNYVHVLATAPGEFFKMVDLEENIEPVSPGFTGLIAVGGNMNHSGPSYDFFTGCAPSASYALTAPQPEVGFVLRVNDHPEPAWADLSTLETPGLSFPAPTVTAVSSFEEDIFVGGYKNDDIALAPSPIGDFVPNLGNPMMNAFFTYISAPYGASQGDFYKTTSTVEEASEEEVHFAVYPNPASNVLYIRMDDASILQQVRLKDLAGRTIQAWNGHEAAGGLSVGNIPSGVYLMEIESDGIRATERVVIQ